MQLVEDVDTYYAFDLQSESDLYHSVGLITSYSYTAWLNSLVSCSQTYLLICS